MKILKLFKILNKYRKRRIAEQAHNALLIDILRTKLVNSEMQVAVLSEDLARLKEDLAKNFVYVTYKYDYTQLINLPKSNLDSIDYKVSKPEFILCYKHKPLKEYEEAYRKLLKITNLIKRSRLQSTDEKARMYYTDILDIIKGKNSD